MMTQVFQMIIVLLFIAIIGLQTCMVKMKGMSTTVTGLQILLQVMQISTKVKIVSVMNQAIHTKGLTNIVQPVQFHLNGISINTVTKFLSKQQTKAMLVIHISNPLFIILLKLQGRTTYFDAWVPCIKNMRRCPKVPMNKSRKARYLFRL